LPVCRPPFDVSRLEQVNVGESLAPGEQGVPGSSIEEGVAIARDPLSALFTQPQP
jgi:hypothetical protein